MENPNDSNAPRKPDSKATETVSKTGALCQKETSSRKIIFSSVQEHQNYRYRLSLTPEQRYCQRYQAHSGNLCGRIQEALQQLYPLRFSKTI
jgi:hypothetical protein